MSLQRERTFILALLLILAAASWAVLIWQSSMMKSMGMGLTMGMGATLFLFPLGIMNIAAMAGLTVVIGAEKMFPRWERIAQGVGLALILSGILVIVVPATLSRSLALM
jgi:predicted metal-binding membrane protein